MFFESTDNETNLIASLLLDPAKTADAIDGGISAESFDSPQLRTIYETLLELFTRNGDFDLPLVANELKSKGKLKEIGGRGAILVIIDSISTASFAHEYITKIRHAEKVKNAKKFGTQLAAAKSSSEVEKIFSELSQKKGNTELGEKSFEEYLNLVLLEESEGRARGINTGIGNLDRMTVGLRAGHFWVIGGLYGTGKTTLALEILRNISKENKVFFYSLEMAGEELLKKIRWMYLQNLGNKNSATDATAKLKNNVGIFTKKQSLAQIETHLLAQKEKPKVVFVDYIQLIETGDKDEYQRTTNVARGLKNLAQRLEIAIVGVSQVSHESANKKLKTIGFRGGGEIAAAVDVGIILTRDAESESGREVVPLTVDIRKNRHGRSGGFDLGFNTKNGMILFET